MNFIIEYWMQMLFSLIVTILGVMYRKVMAEFKEQAEMKLGILAIMQDRLYQSCIHFIKQGSIDVKSMKNIETLYDNYRGLGGNGLGTELYERIMALPVNDE